MCGIAGLHADDPRADVRELLARLTAALEHRGPDGHGIHLARGGATGLGHRRLSIIDLEGGAQPMGSEDGRVQVVYNGEIYNQAELRRQLIQAGHRFATEADTEVLVHGWEEWGERLLPRLNGIYAFAVLDSRGGECALHVARDPVGAKPLYLGRWPGGWWFASELHAARIAGLVAGALDRDALAEWLVYRFVPSPRTLFEGVWKVPPGHHATLQPGAATLRFTRFEHAFAPASLPATRAEWAEALRSGIAEAVRRQLMSDVPVGSLLSGGVDSVLVTRHMCDQLEQRPDCFATGFAGDPVDELRPARRAAQALGTRLHEAPVDDGEYLGAWSALLERQGEPIANSGLLLVGILCRTVARSHKVVLSGQGADEPLGGYPRHVIERFYPWASHARPFISRAPHGLAASDRIERMGRVLGEPSEARRFAEILAVFSPGQSARMVGGQVAADGLADPVRRVLLDAPEGDSVNRLLAADARLSLADDLLSVADLMSMQHGVELRVPFLDLPLLALMERMPSQLKVSPTGSRKWFYRRAIMPDLPPALVPALTGWTARRGRKLGFATPLDRWFSSWVATDAEEMLLGRGSLASTVLNAETVRSVVREARDQGRPRSRQLLSLYVLESWLRGLDGASTMPAATA
jgi:asparagine synthase (glutamine-hydrolysing)